MNSLTIVLGNPFCRPVCSEYNQWSLGEISLRNRWSKIVRCSARRTHQDRRPSGLLCHTKRDETCTTFVTEGAGSDFWMAGEGQC